MPQTKNKACPKCGIENTADAKFCNNCGTKLGGVKRKTAVRHEEPASKGILHRVNGYGAIGFAFVLAVVVVLVILSGNREALYSKLKPANTTHNQDHAHNEEVLQRIQELNMQVLENPNDYMLNIQLANSYFDIRDFSKAVSHYRKALSVKNDDPNVLIDLGVSLFNLDQIDSASVYMKQALEINPDHIQGLFNAGIVYYNMGNFEAAISTWEKLKQKHPQSQEAQRAAGFIEEVKKQLNNS